MIDSLDITGVHFKINDQQKKYINKKIGKLDRLLPRNVKKSVQVKVILSEKNDKKKSINCEVIMELPHNIISAKESTASIFSSVDAVEDKISRQIRKYKTAHSHKSRDRKLLSKILGKARRR